MISFDSDSHRFDLRAAAIVIRGERVLLHRRDGDSFWALPGGRVEAGETAELAVAREFQEELAESIECDRLILVIENFYSHGGVDHHEVGLYFSAALEASSALLTDPGPFDGREGDAALTFAWFNRHRLAEIDVRPSFLVDALGREPLEFRHVVHRDRRA